MGTVLKYICYADDSHDYWSVERCRQLFRGRGCEEQRAVLFSSCIVSLVLFAVYVLSILSETTDASFRTILPAVIIEGLNILLVLVGTALGKVFTVVEYSYVPDSWDLAVGFLSLLGIASLYLVIFQGKNLMLCVKGGKVTSCPIFLPIHPCRLVSKSSHLSIHNLSSKER